MAVSVQNCTLEAVASSVEIAEVGSRYPTKFDLPSLSGTKVRMGVVDPVVDPVVGRGKEGQETGVMKVVGEEGAE